jgi:predicted ribosomally synthesized peptide with nif11-like leader
MSIEAVNQFLQKVSKDTSLQEELALALKSENDCLAATDLAAKHGYMFAPEELSTEIKNRQSEVQQNTSSEEISEEELETVAGGITPIAAAIAGGVAGVTASKKKW